MLAQFSPLNYTEVCSAIFSRSFTTCTKGSLFIMLQSLLSSYGGVAFLCNLNSLSLIIFIISDAKASGSPMQSALRDGCAETAISAPSCGREAISASSENLTKFSRRRQFHPPSQALHAKRRTLQSNRTVSIETQTKSPPPAWRDVCAWDL